MMKSRKLGIGLLLMLAIAVTTGSFAYWRSGINDANGTSSATVTIGSGAAITTSLTVADNDQTSTSLVPVGYTGTNSMSFTIPVQWDETTTNGISGHGGTLGIVEDYTLGTIIDDTTIEGMFTIVVTLETTLGAVIALADIVEGVEYNIIVDVEFTTEPTDQTQYDLVAASVLTIDLTLSVVAD